MQVTVEIPDHLSQHANGLTAREFDFRRTHEIFEHSCAVEDLRQDMKGLGL